MPAKDMTVLLGMVPWLILPHTTPSFLGLGFHAKEVVQAFHGRKRLTRPYH